MSAAARHPPTQSARHSALYVGRVRHRRHGPVAHAFTQRLYMAYLDLSELSRVFAGRWLWSTRRPAPAWFRRADYLGDPALPLDEAVRRLVAERSGHRPEGPIRLLTHLRTWGYAFNPVSFYYCFDAQGKRVQTIVAEVTNTPWGERHCYLLERPPGAGTALHATFRKVFHVSPFLGMDFRYAFHATTPGETLAVHMENRRDGATVFDATLTLTRRELTGPTLAWALLRFPLVTAQVIAGIYYQAARLWLKGVPYVPKPAPATPIKETTHVQSL